MSLSKLNLRSDFWLTSIGVPHLFLPVTNSPAPTSIRTTFSSVLAKNPESYKPIPVVHSLSLSTSLAWSVATASMNEWVTLADSTSRNVPFLWLGPTAAGHLKPPGLILNQGNNALWHYTIEMAKEAHHRELDALGMYNLTLQAVSWDGSNYGIKVALVQAMMVSKLHSVAGWLHNIHSERAKLKSVILGHQLAVEIRDYLKRVKKFPTK